MLGLALLSTAAAYLIYFRLIENVGPTSTVTLLVPDFGLGIILSSVVLITGISLPKSGRQEQEC